MHPASSEAARRQIVEFEELVSRFDRINEQRRDSGKPLSSTSSLDTGLTCYEDANTLGGTTVGSTLSLDRPSNQQVSTDSSIFGSLARWSRTNTILNYLGGGQRPGSDNLQATSTSPAPPIVEQVWETNLMIWDLAFQWVFLILLRSSDDNSK